MPCAQAHWVGLKPIRRVMQLKLHKPTMVIGTRHVDSTNPGRTNLVFRSKPIPEAEMSNRLIAISASPFYSVSEKPEDHLICYNDSKDSVGNISQSKWRYINVQLQLPCSTAIDARRLSVHLLNADVFHSMDNSYSRGVEARRRI